MVKKNIYNLLKSARDDLKKNQYSDAIKKYEYLISSGHSSLEVVSELGLLRTMQQDYAGALPLLLQAVTRDAFSSEHWVNYLFTLAKLNHVQEINAALQKMENIVLYCRVLHRLGEIGVQIGVWSDVKQDVKAKLSSDFSQGTLRLSKVSGLLREYPKSLFLYNLLGVLLSNEEKYHEAIEIYDLALEIQPNFPEAYFNKGNACDKLGLLSDSVVCYKKALSLKDDYFKASFNLALVYHKTNELNFSENYYWRCLELNPTDFKTLANLGELFLQKGEIHRAIEMLKKASIEDPESFENYNNIGIALAQAGNYESSIQWFKKAIKLNDRFAAAYYNLGNSHLKLSDAEKSIVYFKRAVELNPENGKIYNNLGLCYSVMGKDRIAKRYLEKAIEVSPNFIDPYFNLSNISPISKKDKKFSRLVEFDQFQSLTDKERATLYFTIANSLESAGDFEGSFSYFMKANKLKNISGYEIERDKLKFKKIKNQIFTEESKFSEDEVEEPAPIFIVGMPRSGTTLVEQIISNHSEVVGAGELPDAYKFFASIIFDNEKYTLEKLKIFKEEYFKKGYGKNSDFRYFTDKLPINFLFLGFLIEIFPRAKFVHVFRKPEAVCWSNFKWQFASDSYQYSNNMDDIVEFYNLYVDLMRHWKIKYGERIYDLDYDSLVVDLERNVKSLLIYLKLDPDPACLEPHKNKREIYTASKLQIRKKVYSGSSRKWESYEKFLSVFLQNLKV